MTMLVVVHAEVADCAKLLNETAGDSVRSTLQLPGAGRFLLVYLGVIISAKLLA